MDDAVNLVAATDHENDLKSLVTDILDRARKSGADAAEVSASEDAGLSVTVRLGELETVEFNRDRGFGITVYFGKRKGSASTSDSTPAAVAATVQAACNIARFTEEDPCHGLADKSLMARVFPDLDRIFIPIGNGLFYFFLHSLVGIPIKKEYHFTTIFYPSGLDSIS